MQGAQLEVVGEQYEGVDSSECQQVWTDLEVLHLRTVHFIEPKPAIP